ncbi:hypothetical protein K440DRAFT_25704 [Wilcoxina mikolae CBS 423.85]|nr:hypothetical protein K440DRAFT_25704 [Wilcoxina mikolae CBS 423.85]
MVLATVIFHPTRSIVAWSAESGTGAKHLGRKDFKWADEDDTASTRRRPIYIENLQFSECGKFLTGRCKEESICLPIPRSILDVYDPESGYDKDCSPGNDALQLSPLHTTDMSHIPHSSSEIYWAEIDGTAYSLQIRDGAHLLRVDTGGNVETKTLARLPQGMLWDAKHTKVVLTRAGETTPQVTELEVQLMEKTEAMQVALFILNCDLAVQEARLFPMIYRRRVRDMGELKKIDPEDVRDSSQHGVDSHARVRLPQLAPIKLLSAVSREESACSGQTQQTNFLPTTYEPATTSK